MNEIINWMALNNTLMIKIGFTACILLIVAYSFRFFFVPKVKEVELDTSTTGGAAAAVSVNIEELAELQAEIDTLKVKLKQSETEKNNLMSVAKATENSSSAGVETVSAAAPAAEIAAEIERHAKENSEMQEKLRVLEARLSEYEIIAEDIAEISKLRSENVALKAKIESLGTEQSFVETEVPVANDDVVSEVMAEVAHEATEPEDVIADEPKSESQNAAAVGQHIVIESETPVTEDEQNILDEFEKYLNSRKENS